MKLVDLQPVEYCSDDASQNVEIQRLNNRRSSRLPHLRSARQCLSWPKELLHFELEDGFGVAVGMFEEFLRRDQSSLIISPLRRIEVWP